MSTKSTSSAASIRTQKPKPLRTIASLLSSTSLPRKAGTITKVIKKKTRTECYRVHAWSNFSKFAKTLHKDQLIILEGRCACREVEDDVQGTTVQHRVAKVHASSLNVSR